MQKKIFLTESVRKQILADKEKAIIESFAKNFNKIKRIDEQEINEDWKTNLAAGLATAAGGMGAQAQQHQQAPQAHQQTVQTSNDLNSVVSRGGAELGGRLLKAYKANPKAAEQWGAKHRNTAILDNIKSAANFQNNPKDVANLGDMYSGKGSTSLQDVVSFLTATESNAYSFE